MAEEVGIEEEDLRILPEPSEERGAVAGTVWIVVSRRVMDRCRDLLIVGVECGFER